jgi:hypothetical protein
MDQDRQPYTMKQENLEKHAEQVWKITNFDRQTALSMVLLWRKLHRDFLRFAICTRPSGRRGNFTRLPKASTRY